MAFVHPPMREEAFCAFYTGRYSGSSVRHVPQPSQEKSPSGVVGTRFAYTATALRGIRTRFPVSALQGSAPVYHQNSLLHFHVHYSGRIGVCQGNFRFPPEKAAPARKTPGGGRQRGGFYRGNLLLNVVVAGVLRQEAVLDAQVIALGIGGSLDGKPVDDLDRKSVV